MSIVGPRIRRVQCGHCGGVGWLYPTIERSWEGRSYPLVKCGPCLGTGCVKPARGNRACRHNPRRCSPARRREHDDQR